MWFGILSVTAASTDWENLADGAKIQVFAQILYGYGYWGPFVLEFEESKVDCGLPNLETTLTEYGYVTDHQYSSLSSGVATYYVSELNSKLKENLYCLVSNSLIKFY